MAIEDADPTLDECFDLGLTVVAALDDRLAVSIDTVGLHATEDARVRRLLAAAGRDD